MIGAVKNAAFAAGGLIVAEKVGGLIGGYIPPSLPSFTLPAVMALGGAYLGGRGGIVGKLGYGMAVNGLLHVAATFLGGRVDTDFGSY